MWKWKQGYLTTAIIWRIYDRWSKPMNPQIWWQISHYLTHCTSIMAYHPCKRWKWRELMRSQCALMAHPGNSLLTSGELHGIPSTRTQYTGDSGRWLDLKRQRRSWPRSEPACCYWDAAIGRVWRDPKSEDVLWAVHQWMNEAMNA